MHCTFHCNICKKVLPDAILQNWLDVSLPSAYLPWDLIIQGIVIEKWCINAKGAHRASGPFCKNSGLMLITDFQLQDEYLPIPRHFHWKVMYRGLYLLSRIMSYNISKSPNQCIHHLTQSNLSQYFRNLPFICLRMHFIKILMIKWQCFMDTKQCKHFSRNYIG